jgi:DNA processing protein
MEDLVNWLRLIRSENIGTRNFHYLIQRFGSAKAALEAIPEMAKMGGKKSNIKIISRAQAEKEIEKCQAAGVRLLASYEKEYPRLLKLIDDSPPILSAKGRIDILNKKNIAIVGSRHASINGCNFASKISHELGENGFIVTSGLARGIDTAAHKAALASGTIAVFAGGIDVIYPPENSDLAEKITENGLLLAELPIGSVPRAQNFPQRNRIISGLALGIVVIEANLKSGSLITARCAAHQNREVFAVPGFPLDGRYEGTNQLIKQGAHVVTSLRDILEVINSLNQYNLNNLEENSCNYRIPPDIKLDEELLKEARKKVRKALSATPIDIEYLCEYLDLPINFVMAVIVELELAGRVERHSGNKINLIYEDLGSCA